MDHDTEHGRHTQKTALGGWWTVGLASLALLAVAVVVLGIILAVRLLLYLLEVGPT